MKIERYSCFKCKQIKTLLFVLAVEIRGKVRPGARGSFRRRVCTMLKIFPHPAPPLQHFLTSYWLAWVQGVIQLEDASVCPAQFGFKLLLPRHAIGPEECCPGGC